MVRASCQFIAVDVWSLIIFWLLVLDPIDYISMMSNSGADLKNGRTDVQAITSIEFISTEGELVVI